MARQTIVIIEDFYRNPDEIRKYALDQQYYTPYEHPDCVKSGTAQPTWWASTYRNFDDCPFKSSTELRGSLSAAVGEEIDMEHWRSSFPVDEHSRPLLREGGQSVGCLWNCSFHVKPSNGQLLGEGVHNHVTDGWNGVGEDGWAGLLYLNADASLDGGLYLWQNVDPARNFEWMTPADQWRLVDRVANRYNRLTLVRGDIPHSGAGGWGNSLQTGRMYQTFFFRTLPSTRPWPIEISLRDRVTA
jgi:hypothetical protein